MYVGACVATYVGCISDIDAVDESVCTEFCRTCILDKDEYSTREVRVRGLDADVPLEKGCALSIDCFVNLLLHIKYKTDVDCVDMDQCAKWNARIKFDWLIKSGSLEALRRPGSSIFSKWFDDDRWALAIFNNPKQRRGSKYLMYLQHAFLPLNVFEFEIRVTVKCVIKGQRYERILSFLGHGFFEFRLQFAVSGRGV